MNGEKTVSARPPPASLVKKLQDQGNRNAVARCASVRRLLDAHGIAYGARAVNAAVKPDPSELFEATVLTISLPVVSVDGKQALLASSGVSGPLAGAGFLQFLEVQPDGRWRAVASSSLWVS